jgi:NAD(P)-dependent dehydrogenase (short-subunit alcohol dehydrogenase family)
MKAAITGHSKGLGKAFYDALPGSIGFSRSNGYDIGFKADRDRILSASEDYDLFINNAYHPAGQFELLAALLKTDKTIINIGSNIVYRPEIVDIYSLRVYYDSKLALHNLCRSNPTAKIINVVPGSINTPMIENVPVQKMDPHDIAEFILSLVDKPFYVKEVLIDVRAE